MKYAGMPMGMWALFAGSFQKQLTAVLGYDAATARAITKKAKPQYRQIIRRLPEFEKADRFKMNIVNCAMLGAFILSMPQRPEVDRLTDYYAKSMMTKPMQWFCRKSGKSKFTPKDIAAMKATAALKAADRNPYSWNMEFYEYPEGSGYEGRFTKCGICVLMKELGLYDLTPVSYTHLDVYKRQIYNSTIFSDIVKRNRIRKIDQLERVVRYTFANVGNSFTAKSISDYLKSKHRSIDNETVYSYLEKLEKAYLLHRCSRYDLRGKGILKTQEKFYLADTALRYSVLGYTPDSVASSLENVLYLELCRRGYTVTIGKTPDGEVNFVAQKQNDRLYVQVTQEIKSEKTEKREYERLLEIRDNYPKYVLRNDEFAGGNYQGIKSMHIADFLLSAEY